VNSFEYFKNVSGDDDVRCMCVVHFDNVAVAAVTQKLVWSVDTALSGCNWKETMNRLKPCYCWDVN